MRHFDLKQNVVFYAAVCRNFFSEQSARRRKKGFTLIEIMIALSVLSIALVVLLGLRNQGIALAARSRQVIDATLLARQKVTEISAEGFPELGEQSGDFGANFPQYTWRQHVVQTPFNIVRELLLEVVWKEDHREMTVNVTTYLFDRGINPRSLSASD